MYLNTTHVALRFSTNRFWTPVYTLSMSILSVFTLYIFLYISLSILQQYSQLFWNWLKGWLSIKFQSNLAIQTKRKWIRDQNLKRAIIESFFFSKLLMGNRLGCTKIMGNIVLQNGVSKKGDSWVLFNPVLS